MDNKNIVPNLFFDLIARVAPGAVVLLGLQLATAQPIIQNLMTRFAAPDASQSTWPWLFVVLGASYTIGHLLSPAVRFLEKRPEWLKADRAHQVVVAVPAVDGSHPFWQAVAFVFPFWAEVRGSKHVKVTDSGSKDLEKYHEDYNWLRFHHANAAALAVRIRAEYTMYGTLAVGIAGCVMVFLVQITAHYGFVTVVRLWWQNPWRVETAAIVMAPTGIVAMLRRHFTTKRHFESTAKDFLKAAGFAGSAHLDSSRLEVI